MSTQSQHPTHAATKTHLPPTQIAPDAFLIHDHAGEGQAPVLVPLNAMVIRGEQPVVVDTGMADNEAAFLEDVFSLVDPEDVRWVFISHDDIDHIGNLNRLMERCPNATAVISWFIAERMGPTLDVSPARWRWVRDGESIDVGDRVLHAIRPPVYDSPTTRGLFDPSTGVYWSSDSFGTSMPATGPVADAADIPQDQWVGALNMCSHYVSPWLSLVEDAAFQRTVDRVAELRPSVIAGCHTPALSGAMIPRAIEVLRASLTAEVDPEPGQDLLDELQRVLDPSAHPNAA